MMSVRLGLEVSKYSNRVISDYFSFISGEISNNINLIIDTQ